MPLNSTMSKNTFRMMLNIMICRIPAASSARMLPPKDTATAPCPAPSLFIVPLVLSSTSQPLPNSMKNIMNAVISPADEAVAAGIETLSTGSAAVPLSSL